MLVLDVPHILQNVHSNLIHAVDHSSSVLNLVTSLYGLPCSDPQGVIVTDHGQEKKHFSLGLSDEFVHFQRVLDGYGVAHSETIPCL